MSCLWACPSRLPPPRPALRHPTRTQLAFKVHMLYGIPKNEIVKLAREQNIDLVIMGSRGLNAVKRCVLR